MNRRAGMNESPRNPLMTSPGIEPWIAPDESVRDPALVTVVYQRARGQQRLTLTLTAARRRSLELQHQLKAAAIQCEVSPPNRGSQRDFEHIAREYAALAQAIGEVERKYGFGGMYGSRRPFVAPRQREG
jgi:hypothetical protein